MPHFNYFNDEVVIEPELHDDHKEGGKGTAVFEKINTKLSCGSKSIVTREFLKKYISFAKA